MGKKDMSRTNSCNHTLILRTRNRPSWLAASLEGYQKFKYKGIIFVADDSEGEELSKNKETISKYDETDLSIKHLYGLSKGIETRHKRVANSTLKACYLVETDFLTFMGDDDFFFPTFIEPAITFLNENKDHAAVVGPDIVIWCDKKIKKVRPDPHWWTIYQSEDPLERFANYCYSQSLVYYGVFRADYIKLLKEIENKTGEPFTGGQSIIGSIHLDEEIQWDQLLVSSGKIGSLPKLPNSVRIWHQSMNRIEMAIFNTNDPPTPRSHGFFMETLDDRFPATLRHWVKEACIWMKLCGTKYSDVDVYDTVLRWNQKMLAQYMGGGTLSSPDAFTKSLGKNKVQKSKLKKTIFDIQYFLWAIIEITITTLWTRKVSGIGNKLRSIWPISKYFKKSIIKSKEVKDFMDHFNSLDKKPLLLE